MKPPMNILLLSHHSCEKFLQIIVAWKVVSGYMIIWDDLTVLDAILFDNHMNYYNLHKVHSPLFAFNLSMVKRFMLISLPSFLSLLAKFICMKCMFHFDSLVICEVLGLEPSSVVDMYNFNLITCHYNIKLIIVKLTILS